MGNKMWNVFRVSHQLWLIYLISMFVSGDVVLRTVKVSSLDPPPNFLLVTCSKTIASPYAEVAATDVCSRIRRMNHTVTIILSIGTVNI